MKRSSTASDPEEIVEDSEPERIRLRDQSRTTIRSTRSTHAGRLWDTDPVASANWQQQQSFSNGGPKMLATTVIGIDLDGEEAVKLSHARPNTSLVVPEATRKPDEGRTNKSVNLSKFAFTSSSKQQLRSIDVPNSRSITSSSDTRRTVRPAPKKTHLMMSLSLSDFARVSRCICCDASWTTRKTAAQKMDHIQRCARKHGYDEETIRILVKKENSRCLPMEKCAAGNPKATTLLEDLIQETVPKKRHPHRLAGNLVASSSASRKTILARARNIITTSSPDEIPSTSITADFTESTLHDAHGSTTRPKWADCQEVPFMASRLAQKQSTTLFSATNQDEEDTSISSASQSPKQVKLSSKDVRLEKPSSFIISVDIRDVVSAEETNTPIGLSATPKKIPAKRGRPKLKKSEQPSADDADSLPDFACMSRSRTSKAPSATMEVEFREWESFMNNRIRQDKDLNLRILRYEPIDLSLFLKIARLHSPNISDRKLTLHLRDFLDKQAIHFYEANPRR